MSHTRFLDDIRLSEAGPVDFSRLPPWRHKLEVVFRSGSRCCRRVSQIAVDHPRFAHSSETSSTAPEYYFRFAAATLDFRANRPAEPPRVPISRGTPPAHRQLPRHRWRTLRSSALKRGRNGLFLLHPTFHNALGSYTTSVLDASRLFQAAPVDFGPIPPWRHRTGSTFPEWFPVLPKCFPGRPRPPEARPILINIKHRSGILLPVCCRHAGFSRKSSSRTSTGSNSSKNSLPHTGNRFETDTLSKILQVCGWSKYGRIGLLQPHPIFDNAPSNRTSSFLDRF